MAELKKNQLNQIMFVMVDATDFASIESALGAASVAGKFFGVNHGGSVAMTSGALSKACSVVHSGIFRQTLKATECNYDYVVYRFTATGCADQVMAFQTVTNDDSDIYSLMSDFLSDFQSRVPKLVATNSQLSVLASDLRSYLVSMSGMLSDTHSAATLGASRALVNQSMLSDIDSALTSQLLLYTSDISDIKSALTALSDAVSNAYSAAVVGASRALLNQSALSDLDSALTSRFSDIQSLITTTGVQLNASTLSDLRSAIAATTATLGASDISDIASAVWANAIGSDVNSKIGKLASRITKAVATSSQVSDLWSDLLSNFTTTADASDIASAIWAEHYQAQAGASTYGSIFRNLFSNVSDIQSALDSQFLVTTSTLSDIDSALTSQFNRVSDYTSNILSQLLVVQSMASDAASAAKQANSRVLLNQSTP